MLQRLCMPSWQILGDQNGSGELTHCPRVTRGEDKPYTETSGPQHRPPPTSRNSSTNPISRFLSKTQATSLNLPEPQSFLSEAQLRSPAPRKTESIQSWPLEPPLEAWRTDRAKGLTCYQLPPFHLPCQVKASPMTDTSFVVTACSPMQRTSQSPLYPSPDAHSTFISPTSCLV